MRTGGVLLVQPEHLLSFELMGFEQLLRGNSELGNALIRTQHWLNQNSRDILDESDEILSVRFELIYTIGTQRAIELSPDRWTIVEHVLGIAGRFAKEALHKFPMGLEILSMQPGRFPRIRILEKVAGDELLSLVARQVCEAGLPGVPVWNLPREVRSSLFGFITDLKPSLDDTQLLENVAFASDSMKKSILLLRGLFAGGILRFAMGHKRWRVNYGLDLSRTMLAVPYNAKDIPAARAEFSHPDATIVLTCLSYYYGGLSDRQLFSSFEALLLCDSAREEYEQWVRDAPELPISFRQITGINLINVKQCTEQVFPPLRFAKGAVDFYMSHIVFPREMREFPSKLSSSGWDIAREKIHPTTGFSGTNDSRYILPLSINQCDLRQQLPTNAAVLDCLLRPENSFTDICEMETLDAELLLRMVVKLNPPVRVILDVGAQVLDLKNEEVVREWLSLVPESEAQAAIFFNDRNDLCVLSRDGTIESLMVSSFAKQMDQCLVYLDEAHTRGTDLRMPTNYRAIVTLGPALTKDRLVQGMFYSSILICSVNLSIACMRMRKLGQGQSVVFCGPADVKRKILESSGKFHGDVEVADVLKWCISETYAYTKNSIPLWATQGVRYQSHYATLSRTSDSQEEDIPEHVAKALLEEEAQSLEERYGLTRSDAGELAQLRERVDESCSTRREQLDAILAKCREFELTSLSNASLREEQERELSPENEREQQVELPPASKPHNHTVHEYLRRFIRDGAREVAPNAFQPAFKTLTKTTASKFFEAGGWPEDLLVTTDFARTIAVGKDELLDSFMRPVHWIISRKNIDKIQVVIVSPYEAQELLPSLRKQKAATLHVYAPRLTSSMRVLEDLSFCSTPPAPRSGNIPSVVTQLNLFAGQLYLRTYEEYVSLCNFLGLCSQPPDNYAPVACDGFMKPDSREIFNPTMAEASPFTTSPVPFLRIVTSLRRKGQSYATSHMGRVLYGELVGREQFQDRFEVSSHI